MFYVRDLNYFFKIEKEFKSGGFCKVVNLPKDIIKTDFDMNFRFNFTNHSLVNFLSHTSRKDKEQGKSRKGRGWRYQELFNLVEKNIDNISYMNLSQKFALKGKNIVLIATLEECGDEESTYIINVINVLSFKGKDSDFIHIKDVKEIILAC